MVLIHVIAKRPQSLDPLHGGGRQEIRMRMKCEMGWPRRRLEEGLKANIGIPKRSRVLYDVVCSRIPSFPGEQFVKPFVADAETVKDMGIEEDARLSVEFIQAQVEKKKKENKRTIVEAHPPVRRGDQKKNKRTIDEARPPPVRREGFDRAAKDEYYKNGLDNVQKALVADAAEKKKQQQAADRARERREANKKNKLARTGDAIAQSTKFKGEGRLLGGGDVASKGNKDDAIIERLIAGENVDGAFDEDDNNLIIAGGKVKIKLGNEDEAMIAIGTLVGGKGSKNKIFKKAVKTELTVRKKDESTQNQIACVNAGTFKLSPVTHEQLLTITHGSGRTLDESSNSKKIVPGIIMVKIPLVMTGGKNEYEERIIKVSDIDTIKDRLLLYEFAFRHNWQKTEYTMYSLNEKQNHLFWSIVYHAKSSDRFVKGSSFRDMLEIILPSTENHASSLETLLDRNEELKTAMKDADIELEEEFHVDWVRLCSREQRCRDPLNIDSF